MPYKDPEKRRANHKVYRRKYYLEHKEREAELCRAWRQAHPESNRRSAKGYRERNIEECKERERRYRKNHPAKMAAKRDKFKGDNPHYHREKWKRMRTANISLYLIRLARARAKAKDILLTITEDDIDLPEFCPVLGIRLNYGNSDIRNKDASPSLDRIVPSLGYVPGNVRVISWRANNLKSDATVAEMEAVLAYMKRELLQEIAA